MRARRPTPNFPVRTAAPRNKFPLPMNHEIRSNLDVSDEEMRRLSLRVVDAVVTHLATLRDQPAQKSLSRAEARAMIAGPAPEKGIPFDEILSFLDKQVFPNHAREPHPHFMGYI